jgi:hypothetical protein
MNYKETLFFVGKCLTITHEEQFRIEIEKELISNTVNWDNVVKVSTGHYVFPALYCNLKRADFLKYLPDELVAYMEYITDLNRERNQEIIEQAKEINELLLKNNITPIFLKGTGNILEGLYDDIAERMLIDIDIIVSEKDFLLSAEILLNQEYKSIDNLNRNFHWHYPILYRDDKMATVEIHNKILKNNYQNRLEIDLFNDLIIINSNIHVLSTKNKLISTILPKIINDDLYHNKSISLRDAYDVLLISKLKPIDITSIKNQKINQKLTNYLSCIKLILNDIISISSIETHQTIKYKNQFVKVLEGDTYEKTKNHFIDFLIVQKNRLEILKMSFQDPVYRRYTFKRIFQLDFYKRIFGIKKS